MNSPLCILSKFIGLTPTPLPRERGLTSDYLYSGPLLPPGEGVGG